MNKEKKILRWIKLGYWLGIGADALWTIGLFIPPVFGMLIGRPEFQPDMQTRSIMLIGGSLMSGWTLLLLWAVRKPIERRVVILLTAVPVVLGLFITAIIDFFSGNTFILWILIKCPVLIITMILSYVLAGRMDLEKN